jgi:hypothetical protein
MADQYTLIQYLTRIQFDFGSIELLPKELKRLSVMRPLLITDPGVNESGHRRRVELLCAGIPVFKETPENPTESAVSLALELFRQEQCDSLVALGGGSAMDLAKAVALMATHPGCLEDYGVLKGGSKKIHPVTPLIAIPTTAGTGSEVGRACSITLNNGSKVACVSLNLVPSCAICDPELTLTLSAFLTAATGFDALSHGIESFLSTRINPPAEAIALDCVARSGNWLKQAVVNGHNRDARWQMMMAALEGGLTFQKGLGVVHALSHPLGALGPHHGTLNAILLPHALNYNERYVPEKFDQLKQTLKLRVGCDLVEWSKSLAHELGLPGSLSQLGINKSELSKVAELASKDHLLETNPRPCNEEDLLGLLVDAF